MTETPASFATSRNVEGAERGAASSEGSCPRAGTAASRALLARAGLAGFFPVGFLAIMIQAAAMTPESCGLRKQIDRLRVPSMRRHFPKFRRTACNLARLHENHSRTDGPDHDFSIVRPEL
jgi:hypothetical protein